jgi:hypothetical protein
MKKRIFYFEHLLQIVLLTRFYHDEHLPYGLFAAIIIVLLGIKYQLEGFTVLTLAFILCLILELSG